MRSCGSAWKTCQIITIGSASVTSGDDECVWPGDHARRRAADASLESSDGGAARGDSQDRQSGDMLGGSADGGPQFRVVSFAQEAHANLLRSGGGLTDEELIVYRRPWPVGKTAEGVMVDDHAVVHIAQATDTKEAAEAELRRVGAGGGEKKIDIFIFLSHEGILK